MSALSSKTASTDPIIVLDIHDLTEKTKIEACQVIIFFEIVALIIAKRIVKEFE